MTIELVQQLLRAYGEDVLASDDSLIQEMIELVSGSGHPEEAGHPEEPLALTPDIFSKVLTSDVLRFNIEDETRRSTTMEDVGLPPFELIEAHPENQNNHQDTVDSNDEQVETAGNVPSAEPGSASKAAANLRWKRSAGAADTTAGIYRSKTLLVCLYVTVIITYFAYWAELRRDVSGLCPEYLYDYNSPWETNGETMACDTFVRVFDWLGRFALFCAFGIVFIGVGNIGNSSLNPKWWLPLVGMGFILVITVIPYRSNNSVRGKGFLDNASLIFGAIVCFLHFLNIVAIFEEEKRNANPEDAEARISPRWKTKLLAPSTLGLERNLKLSASWKMNEMVQASLKIFPEITKSREGKRSTSSQVFGSFYGSALQTSGEVCTEHIGGLRWTWERIQDKSLTKKEGIWFNARRK